MAAKSWYAVRVERRITGTNVPMIAWADWHLSRSGGGDADLVDAPVCMSKRDATRLRAEIAANGIPRSSLRGWKGRVIRFVAAGDVP